jgi:uncharacterized protein (TIGR00251 family)
LSSPAAELRIDPKATGVGFWIHVSPRSRKERVGGLHGDALRVAVPAAPVKGKANEACVRALAKALGKPPAEIELDPGSKGRRKRVVIHGDPDTLSDLLRALATDG